MVEDIACHDEVEVVLRGHRVVLSHSLLHILEHGIHVASHLALGDTPITQRTHLLHHAGQRIAPVAGIRVHRDGSDRTALAEGVTVVDLHGRMVGAVTRDDSELQNSDEDAHRDEVPNVLQSPKRAHGRFRIEVHLKTFQELIAEDPQGPVPWDPTLRCIEGGGVREGGFGADHRQTEVVELLRPIPRNLPAVEGAGIGRLAAPDRIQGCHPRRGLMSRRCSRKDLFNALHHVGLGDVAHNIERGVAWVVPLLVECTQILLLPSLDLLLLADRELRAELVGLVQP
mmetsp:Transcript_92790/g.198967  ORF Transcript_92790/g.198967 Transcript_92790/m.198967 type:complete len:285 (+) Transcript_92790:2037-2891(+)